MTDRNSPADVDVLDAEFGALGNAAVADTDPGATARDNLQFLYDVPVRVSAELGQTVITIRNLLSFGPGSVIELERLAGESVDLMVNGVLIGKGDVVVVNENFGLRITEIVCLEERLKKLSDAG